MNGDPALVRLFTSETTLFQHGRRRCRTCANALRSAGHYTHVLPDGMREAAEKVREVMR